MQVTTSKCQDFESISTSKFLNFIESPTSHRLQLQQWISLKKKVELHYTTLTTQNLSTPTPTSTFLDMSTLTRNQTLTPADFKSNKKSNIFSSKLDKSNSGNSKFAESSSDSKFSKSKIVWKSDKSDPGYSRFGESSSDSECHLSLTANPTLATAFEKDHLQFKFVTQLIRNSNY